MHIENRVSVVIFHKISFCPLSILYISPFLQNFDFFQKKVLTFQKTYAILINVVRDNTPKQRNRDVAQFGRAPALGAGSRRFKSCHLDQSHLFYGGFNFDFRTIACAYI